MASGTQYTPDKYIAPLADFLSGRTSDASIAIGDPERQVFVNTFFLNAGDSWQVNRKLNLNYGIRYDYTGPFHNSQKNMSVFRPELTGNRGLAIQGSEVSSLFQQYWTSFSPRVGISFAPDEKTVIHAGYGWYFDSPNLNPFLDNRPGNSAPNGVEGNPTGPSPVYTVDVGEVQILKGQAIFPSALNGSPCLPATPCGIFSVDRNFRPSYNENYSFNVERTLSPSVIAQIGFVGSQGRHLLSLLDINQAEPGVYSSAAARQTARPFNSTYPQYGNINQIESIGTSNYSALQAQIRTQNWHRFSSQIVYTWSHNLDEVTAYRGALPQDSFNFKGDYSNSDFDTRNTFTGFFSYAVPGFSHGPRELSSGWQVNSLLSFHGGQPFTVLASGDRSGTNEGNDRAVLVGNVRKGFQGQTPNASWLDPAAFADPAVGSFGTTRRNAFYGPGYSDVDLSVFKDTHLSERITVQLRAEMFNLLNRTNFAPPSSTSSGGSFTLSDTIGDFNGAPGIGAGEPFNTQFGAKIIF